MDELTNQRMQRAAESILENESLTDELDDAAAQVLLDWGVAQAERIARDAQSLDEAAAEETMAPRLRALRRLMRRVNRWAGRPPEGGTEDPAVLEEIVEQAALVYGEEFSPPPGDQRAAFLAHYTEQEASPLQRIESLRQLLEGSAGLSEMSEAPVGVSEQQEEASGGSESEPQEEESGEPEDVSTVQKEEPEPQAGEPGEQDVTD